MTHHESIQPRIHATPRVFIAEDDARLRNALAAQLVAEGFEICGTAGTVELAVGSLTDEADVALVDLGLPDGHGTDIIRAARERGIPALVLSAHGDDATVFEALKAGASGYCLKSDGVGGLGSAIRFTLDGGAAIAPSIARRLIDHFRRVEGTAAPERAVVDARPALTERERELMDLFASGCTYGEVANILGISINTVRHHVRGLYEKLHVSSKAEAIATWYGTT